MKECVKKILSITDHVDILICNAGVLLASANEADKQKIEPHLAVNMLAHAFLFNQLRKLLELR